jgi:hypothetical protein
VLAPNATGPTLIHHGVSILPRGFDINVRGRSIEVVGGGYKLGERWLNHALFRWTLTRTGARLTVRGVHRGDRFRMLAYTPAGTGRRGPRTLRAAGARWRFDRPIHGRRITGYHSGPMEQLDALEARFSAPKSGRFVIEIGV